MSYRIQRDPNTSLWIVFFQGVNFRSLPDGNILSRAAEPQVAINLARQRVQQLNDPITGIGPGTLPALDSVVEQELLSRAAAIEQQEREQFEKSRNDQGPGTVSTGETTAEAAAARDNEASTQSPPPAAESASPTGSVSNTPASAVPSNAAPNQPTTPTAPPDDEKLPTASVGPGTPTPNTVPAAVGQQSPIPSRQSGGVNLDTPDENTNQVSYIYRAYLVTSNFRQGRFTQDIQGAQIFFPLTAAQQNNPDSGRRAPDQAASGVARSQRQGTVDQTAATPGVPIFEPAAPGLLELQGVQDPTVPSVYPGQSRSRASASTQSPGGSLFEAEGFGDPTAEQVPATAPLTAAPPTTGTSSTASVSPVPLNTTAKTTQGNAQETSLQDQLKLARLNEAQFAKALEQVEARIARGEGNPLANREMRALYSTNLRKEREIIADLEARLADNQARSQRFPGGTVNISPQTGAKEY
jgi:hypothetical protein